MTTKHTCNDGAGPVFGRKTCGCPRCDELLSGAKPVVWGASRAEQDAQRARWVRGVGGCQMGSNADPQRGVRWG